MGAFFSSPSQPNIPTPPPAAAPATMADPQVALSASNAKSRAAAAATADGTVGTSPQGLTTPATTAYTTLLGGTK
jgi:hypothetical protein